METTREQFAAKAIRLDLREPEYVRVDRLARQMGLNKASLARLAVMTFLDQEEAKRKGR